MVRNNYNPSISTSTRTFQTPSTAPETVPDKPSRSRLRLRRPIVRFAAKRLPWALVVIFLLVSIFMYVQYQDARSKLHPSQAASLNTKQITDTLHNVSKLVIVPSNETPTVATVSNVSKLRGQSFFANAKDGDKVIVYPKAKQAILYRPSSNQIVTMAPLSSPASPQ
jgi:hypothetical protein